MLLFKPEHVPLILNGTKTQTRRIWRQCRVKVDSIQQAKIQMLSHDFFAKLRILRVWQEPLGQISDEDALKEGYLGKGQYLEKFLTINKINTPEERIFWLVEPVWCIEFQVVKTHQTKLNITKGEIDAW